MTENLQIQCSYSERIHFQKWIVISQRKTTFEKEAVSPVFKTLKKRDILVKKNCFLREQMLFLIIASHPSSPQYKKGGNLPSQNYLRWGCILSAYIRTRFLSTKNVAISKPMINNEKKNLEGVQEESQINTHWFIYKLSWLVIMKFIYQCGKSPYNIVWKIAL